MKYYITQISQLVLGSAAVRQSVVLTLGTTLTAVLSAVAFIYISRVLGPEQFGIFSVAIAIMTIVSRLGDMGLNTVITRQLSKSAQRPGEAQQLLGQIVLWKIMLLAVGLSLLIIGAYPVMNLINYPYPTLFGLALVGSVSLTMYEHVLVVLSALHEFKWVNVLSMSQATIKVISFLALGLMGLATAVSVSLFYHAAPAVGAVLVALWFTHWLIIKPQVAPPSVQYLIKSQFFHLALGVVAVMFINNVDILFVQKYLSSFETGLYAGSTRVALFITLLTSAVGGVLNNRVARYHDKAVLSRYLLKSVGVIGLAVVLFLGFLVFSKWVLLLTIGPQYASGWWVMVLLVANACLAFAEMPLMSFFYAVNYPSYFSLGGILQVIVMVVIMVWWVPVYGLEAAAIARIMATVAHVVFTLGYLSYAYRRL